MSMNKIHQGAHTRFCDVRTDHKITFHRKL